MDVAEMQRSFALRGITIPPLRERMHKKELEKDEEAYDQLGRRIASLLNDPTDEDIQRWRRIYRKMKEHRHSLRRNGSIHKKGSHTDASVLKFRRPKNGRRVQSSIHLGNHKMVVLTLFALDTIRNGHTLDKLIAEKQSDENGGAPA